MKRELLCRTCTPALSVRLPQVDARLGLKVRSVYLCIESRSLVCDYCGNPLVDPIVVAFTMWREGEAGPGWEEGFGTILDPEIVSVYDKLSETIKP